MGDLPQTANGSYTSGGTGIFGLYQSQSGETDGGQNSTRGEQSMFPTGRYVIAQPEFSLFLTGGPAVDIHSVPLLNQQAMCYFPEGSRKLAASLPRTMGSYPQQLWISCGGNATTEERPEGEGGNRIADRLASN